MRRHRRHRRPPFCQPCPVRSMTGKSANVSPYTEPETTSCSYLLKTKVRMGASPCATDTARSPDTTSIEKTEPRPHLGLHRRQRLPPVVGAVDGVQRGRQLDQVPQFAVDYQRLRRREGRPAQRALRLGALHVRHALQAAVVACARGAHRSSLAERSGATDALTRGITRKMLGAV